MMMVKTNGEKKVEGNDCTHKRHSTGGRAERKSNLNDLARKGTNPPRGVVATETVAII